jgi:ribosomal-protein-alanine N-acetyltransferase
MNYLQKKFPANIEIGDYILREKTIDDAKDFLEYFSSKEVSKHILCTIPQNIEEARREVLFWRNVFYSNDGIYFAIAKKADNQMIGSIGLNNYNMQHKRIEISYDLAYQYWNKGITGLAIKELIKFGYEYFDINRIEAFMTIDNIASKNLLSKIGFTNEGILRSHRYYQEKFYDVLSFSFIKDDLNIITAF